MVDAPVLLAVVSAACFLGLAHAAVTTPRTPFRRMTFAMAAVAVGLTMLSPAAGVALLGPVLLSRRLANATIPATVPELLARYSSADPN
jgi:ABC-type transport system involved in cytochrome c biogenesis permease subunit